MNTLLRFAGISLVVLPLFLTGCGGGEAGTAPSEASAAPTPVAERTVRVQIVTIQPTTFEDVIQLTGSVEATNDALLSAQSAGTLTSLVPLGRAVGAGQTVAQIDPSLLRASLQQADALIEAAEAQYSLAQDNFRRQEPLYRDSIISALEFETIRTQLNAARAQVNQAKAGRAQVEAQLRYTRVVAPFGGTIEEHLAQAGEQVMPGTPVARLVSTGTVKVKAGVPERYAADIRMGTTALVHFASFGDERRQGTVTFVGKAIDPQNRSFPVEIALPNPDGQLKPEMVANVAITRASLENRLVLPQAAILNDEEGSSVFIVRRDAGGAKAERRRVVVGPSYDNRTVIENGLEPGAEVIVVGQQNVNEGDLLEIVEN
jgi:membrane fusion protein (multidrug efflux system)